MKLTDLDQKVLTDLGLDKLSEDQKQTILEKLDKTLLNRFIAKLLTSVPKDKYPELEKALEQSDKGNPDEFFERAINLHPDAKKVLEESAKEVIEEFKKQPAGGSSQAAVTPTTPTPPTPHPQASDGTESGGQTNAQPTPNSTTDKAEAEHKLQPPEDKPEPTESPVPGEKSDTNERPGDITPPTKDNTDAKSSTPNPSDSDYYQAG